MKNRLLLILFIILGILSTCQFAHAQALNRISGRCPSPNQNTYGSVLVQNLGDINLVPCVGRNVLINGTALPSSFAGMVTGTGTANFVPRFTAASVIGNTPLSWNGTVYTFNNTALNSEFTMAFRPNNTSGNFTVGDITTTPTNYINLSQFGNLFEAAVLEFRAGDVNLRANQTYFHVIDSTQQFRFLSANNLALMDFGGISSYSYFKTITASGTTGNQTINKPAGTVNLAAAASSVTVTNNTVSTASTVFVTTRTNDATCFAINAVPASGSFVINMSAACTAETSVGFLVTN